ncbi:MAG: histidine kinase [Bacteroidetes bacterium GWF2_42_66]|nr:MAG: histidine kinase [Bacteroidetes bacterium GWA2_42_15]OFX97767.1 MAG: histidine kinase [Bacteroidetes bacterium GWE2_42_39]OFY45494.1 MAG: histidine kinase [Bacteroidetes bacterium GWF2_42_66]HAZ02841.1 response regulator [Marinilabiliales bacterium]HBL73787.1 response regulator [Prolixibacteraceae bacterium]
MDENIKPQILIAEDVESNFLYLNAVLSKIDAKIFWAKNGTEAVEIFKKQNIDLILMDLQMPDMNGFEATKAIKIINPNVPVIAQTAFAMADDREKAIQAGCDDYLSKPIKSNDLLSAVKKYLEK